MEKPNTGIYYAVASSLTFSFMNVLVKATSASVSSHQIVFFRSIIGLIIVSMIMKKEKISLSKHNRKILVLRGMLGGFYMIAYFLTLSKLPLIDTMILVNLSPLFVYIISRVLLKEKGLPGTKIAISVIIIGAITAIAPWNFTSFTLWAIAGILAALFAGASAVSIRYLGQEGHPSTEIIFYFMLMASITSFPLMIKEFVWPSVDQWIALIFIGVISLLAQIYLTRAFTHENAFLVTVVRYVGIVFNGIWGFLLWKEVPSSFVLIGGSFIISGCILLNYSKNRVVKTISKDHGVSSKVS
ncbi:DMT family transporter [Tindallia californiensis]|uniref:Permease of the drug/metabolite transporter (DMT) superfamily n=1 Tax=Tindallia californiensis TaxID=159292 RepID=A0A1H3QEN5_9FIRM|nr:DMT family transporter [Tindallia californiensis]SDZ11518.1 Permease of the drug/metabolite transporter (DMT) superfamily [Tindallia californiensis]